MHPTFLSIYLLRLLRALRASPHLGDTLLSIDTYRAEVAAQAVYAGADIVNDVSGGTLDPGMLAQVCVYLCANVCS